MLPSGVRMSCARSAVYCESRWKPLSRPPSIVFSAVTSEPNSWGNVVGFDAGVELVDGYIAGASRDIAQRFERLANQQITHEECDQHAGNSRHAQAIAIMVE